MIPDRNTVTRPDKPAFFNEKEAAEFLRISAKTLERYRQIGGGPVFRKIGTRVIYGEHDLTAWITSRPAYKSTAQY